MEFGRYLRDLRKNRRLTQQQLADAVGVDFTYLSKVENSRVDPPSEVTIRKLAEALEADPDQLLSRAGKPIPELRDAASEDPQLALLLRTISGRRLQPDQYQRMLAIAEEEPAVVADDFIPDAELERQADQLLAQYAQRVEPITRPPVPIDLIIEHVLDIDIDWAPLEQRTQGTVLAAIEVTQARRRILMNERERVHFERFFGTEAYSKAHEVGHALLHLPQTPGLQPPLASHDGLVTLCRSSQRDAKEIQAERFAAYLLMPEALLRAAVGQRPLTHWRQLYWLRDSFQVSITAMRRRLEALNLVYVDHDGRVYPSREAATGQLTLPQ